MALFTALLVGVGVVYAYRDSVPRLSTHKNKLLRPFDPSGRADDK